MDGKWEPPEVENPRCQTAVGCGPWKSPMIPNPAYKGKWSPPMIDNPNFQGKWEPRRIENPNFFDDPHPFHRLTTIEALALELWSSVDGVVFDNFLVTSDESIAKKFAEQLWATKFAEEEKHLSPSPPSTSTSTTTTTSTKTTSSTIESIFDQVKTTLIENPWILFVSIVVSSIPAILFVLSYSRSQKPKKIKKRKPVEESQVEEIQIDEDENDEDYEDEQDEAERPKPKQKEDLNVEKRPTPPAVEEKTRRRHRKK